MKLFLAFLLISSNFILSQDLEEKDIVTTTCTEEFLIQDQLFIDKYGGSGKKSVRQTVKLKN